MVRREDHTSSSPKVGAEDDDEFLDEEDAEARRRLVLRFVGTVLSLEPGSQKQRKKLWNALQDSTAIESGGEESSSGGDDSSEEEERLCSEGSDRFRAASFDFCQDERRRPAADSSNMLLTQAGVPQPFGGKPLSPRQRRAIVRKSVHRLAARHHTVAPPGVVLASEDLDRIRRSDFGRDGSVSSETRERRFRTKCVVYGFSRSRRTHGFCRSRSSASSPRTSRQDRSRSPRRVIHE